jgi:hypothetical protein
VDDPGGHGQLLHEVAAVAGAVCEQPLTRPHHNRMQQQPKLVEQICVSPLDLGPGSEMSRTGGLLTSVILGLARYIRPWITG